MPKLSDTYNLLSIHPQLALEWHPTGNGKLTPNEITPGSHRKIWWQCKNGHEWQAAVYSRSRGSGCPHCHGESLIKGKPILDCGFLAQWHPTLNHGLNPRNVTATCRRKLWWICPFGHEWQDTLKRRLKGEGCPQCAQDKDDVQPSRFNPPTRTGPDPRISIFRIENGEVLESYTDTDFRKQKRYFFHAAVIAERSQQDQLTYASMKNFSPDGMSIETDYPIREGEKIVIHIKEKPTASSPTRYQCRVRWCKEMNDDEGKMTGYSVGLQILSQ